MSILQEIYESDNTQIDEGIGKTVAAGALAAAMAMPGASIGGPKQPDTNRAEMTQELPKDEVSAIAKRMKLAWPEIDEQKEISAPRLEEMLAAEQFPIPKFVNWGVGLLMLGFVGLGTFNNVFFYAEPGYIYHVRTVMGEERVISGTGYYYHLFGRINDWKREMSVQASSDNHAGDSMNSETESTQMSAGMAPIKST